MKKLMLIISLLSVFVITNAQVDENIILDTAIVQKNEIKITPEITEMAVEPIKNMSEKYYSTYGIKNKSQLENLHLGKPIPLYNIENENLIFTGNWSVPVISEGKPLFFEMASFKDGEYFLLDIGNANIIEHIYNYEHKDLIIGSLSVPPFNRGMGGFLIIRKENKDIFVQVYDEVTHEYCKNEYSFSELGHLLKEHAKIKAQERSRYLDKVAQKSELKMTPEITEMVITEVYSSFIDDPDWNLSNFGIKDRSQLENLHLGKPIPMYVIRNDSLKFRGTWQILVMSDGEPLFLERVKLESDGQYRDVGGGGAEFATHLHNYEHKDLIIGFLGVRREMDYLIIRKENKDIFVQSYDYATREYFKNEYSLSEIINQTKE